MLEKLKSWFKKRLSGEDSASVADARVLGARPTAPNARPKPQVPRRKPEFVEADDDLSGEVESNGPGKNVLIRNKFHREDTGTHETLKILDDTLVDSGEETGLDPYNTGAFDRSKNWDRRFGK